MVFINLLRVVHAAVEAGRVILCESHEALEEQEDVADCTEDGVGGFKVRARVGKFGVEDGGEAGVEGDDGESVDYEVDCCSLAFLVGGVGWLED